LDNEKVTMVKSVPMTPNDVITFETRQNNAGIILCKLKVHVPYYTPLDTYD
jgi:hypothetical protein